MWDLPRLTRPFFWKHLWCWVNPGRSPGAEKGLTPPPTRRVPIRIYLTFDILPTVILSHQLRFKNYIKCIYKIPIHEIFGVFSYPVLNQGKASLAFPSCPILVFLVHRPQQAPFFFFTRLEL